MWRWCVVAVTCGGCPPPEVEPPVCPLDIALGDGATPFRARSEGEDAVIVHGPQGGYHVEVSVRAWGTTPPWTVLLTATELGGEIVVSEQEYHLLPNAVDGDPCAAELPKLLAILDVHELDEGTPAEVLDGSPILLRAVVVDEGGEALEVEVGVTARAGESG